MAKLSLAEQLDQALEAMIANPDATTGAAAPEAEPEIFALLAVARELRDLPRHEFKARLGRELEGSPETAENSVSPAIGNVKATTYLCVREAARAIEFYQHAFGATELMRLTGPEEKISHACLLIGGAQIMLADEVPEANFLSPQSLGGSPARIYLEVDDVDVFARRAVAAGATEVRPIVDQFYGARSGQFADPFGYVWIISTRTEAMSFAEMQRRYDEKLLQGQKTAVNPIREGFHTITPYIAVREAEELIEFIQQAFGAEGKVLGIGSQGGIHAEYRIGDSMLMIGGGKNFRQGVTPTSIHLYVRDADEVYRRALAAGAESMHEPVDQPYGDREGSVKDIAGNYWYIATHTQGTPSHEGEDYRPDALRDVNIYLHPKGAPQMIDFLARAFGAEEVALAQSPEGYVYHAKYRIGDSVIEMGEAHGIYQPMPTMIYLYVDDCDGWYRRALAAGATSIAEPHDQGYGDRTAGVTDPFGNIWYMGTNIGTQGG